MVKKCLKTCLKNVEKNVEKLFKHFKGKIITWR